MVRRRRSSPALRPRLAGLAGLVGLAGRPLAAALIATAALGGATQLAGCGDEMPSPPASAFDASVGDADTTSEASVVDDTDGGDGGPRLAGGGTCTTAADCDGGTCVSGACCAAAAACGATCCGAGTTCVFDRCVAPGKVCHSASDCAPNQYCEPSLGAGAQTTDGGAADGAVSADAGDAGFCTHAPPTAGRCLDLPPTCASASDAGASSDAASDASPSSDGGVACLPVCEYHPPTEATLSAVAKWTWGPTAGAFPEYTDVWSTPTVGRLYDGNCDGTIDANDAPSIVFVAGRAIDGAGTGTCCQCNGTSPTACHTGVLRMLDGPSGAEIWSVKSVEAGSDGFSGLSTAIGDLDGDGRMDIAAVTGEGYVVIVDASNGKLKRKSNTKIPGSADAIFGWGGGLGLADMDNDGFPEVLYGATVYTTKGGGLTQVFSATGGVGGDGSESTALATAVDLDGDGALELLAGHTAYKNDGTVLWNRANLADGFSGVGDFDKDGKPEVVLVHGGKIDVLHGIDGTTALAAVTLPGTGFGGPPTVADFDGDGKPEIGVAQATKYTVVKPNYAQNRLDVLWAVANHDFSSSVTGSTVFDFEGDGRAEVIYADECFLWVFDGQTGATRFATPHTSFTATEASLVADVDGDGHAEMVMVSNGADPSVNGWACDVAPWNAPDPTRNRPAWKAPAGAKAYRGLTVFGDASSAWVGTRTLWNEHTYHVSNVCDDRDNACGAPNVYGSIPKKETANVSLPWLNDFRQNVQDKGIYDAPDATLNLEIACTTPLVAKVTVRNLGSAGLPAGVDVAVYVTGGGSPIATAQTTRALLPGQIELLSVPLPASATTAESFYAVIAVDPLHPKFHECRSDNDRTGDVHPSCAK